MLFSELFTAFQKARSLDHSPETTKGYRYAVDRWVKICGDKDTYTAEDVDNFKYTLLTNNISRTTVNIWIRALCPIQNFGLSRGIWPKRFIALKDQCKLEVLPPAYLKPEEFERLLANIYHKHMKTLILLLAFTGARVGEALRLEWKDIEGDVWTIYHTKSKRFRHVILHPRVLAELEKLPHDQKPFRSTRTSVAQAVRRARKRAGLPDTIHTHSLRHTCASWLVQQGVSLPVVAACLGHSTLRMTQKYAHLELDDQRQAIARLQSTTVVPGSPLLTRKPEEVNCCSSSSLRVSWRYVQGKYSRLL